MGFITTQNLNGREVYACEAERSGCQRYPCRAHRCPHKWCQRFYFCAACWAQIGPTWKQEHAQCQPRAAAYAADQARDRELLAAGHFLRRAALNHDGRVKVIFRNQSGEERAYWMAQDTYRALPLITPATVEDYQAHGTVDRAASLDIHDEETVNA